VLVVVLIGGEWVPELSIGRAGKSEDSVGGVCECEEFGRESTREVIGMEFKMSGGP